MAEYFLILLSVFLSIGVASWLLLPGPWSRILLWAGRKASGLHSNEVIVGGLNWHYLSGGQGTSLVAIHGFGADADHWQRVAPLLSSRFEITAPDLIGFGDSHPGDSLPFAIDDQVDRLAALLDHLKVDSCVMAGSSMGGWIASRFAQRFPEKVKGLWLLAPLGVRDCERGELLNRISTDRESPLSIGSVSDFERLVYRPMFARPPHLPRPLRMHYGQRAVRRSRASQRMFNQVY
ncbi:MAG: alpha/beta fold hydrolase, partial [Desulfofustis sp.]|nr:alpha/beta fold hydrolase [Desulfofustis sp.]